MSIAGDWYNEFGSHMRLTVDSAGAVGGAYTSAAGHATGAHALAGRYHPPGAPGRGAALGWTVAWDNQQTDEGSVTSWSGQYFEQEERIYAGWLLTRAASAADAWESTVVGQDVFTREQPAAGPGEERRAGV
ncbi:hypothetical protein GCM10009760_41580 [Kitasatospora kazusensis]|uniref:Avidin family protein n=1 Tax=Kitasatospora kazusensis TaxID=407974 RepID=A0ABN2ZWD1_9ACTN